MDEDVPLSAQQILQLQQANARLQAQNEQLLAEQASIRAEKQQLQSEKELLQEELKELKRVVFSQKHERFVPTTPPNQLSLQIEGDLKQPAVVFHQTVQYERVVRQAAKVALRQPFPAHLPRIDVLIQPQEDVSKMRKIGEEITEELDLKPASLFVRRYIRPRYVSVEETLLKNYQGHLQTDGYGVYEQFESRKSIVIVGCMAHARRYFEYALENDRPRAEKVLLWMHELYTLEREAREQNLSAKHRYALRKAKARQIMEQCGYYQDNHKKSH